MTHTPDLSPSAERLVELGPAVQEGDLDGPTPCEGRTVHQLLGHVVGLAAAFRAAADKELGPLTDTTPDAGGGWPDASGDWRSTLSKSLPALVASWANPQAWEGVTRVGGQDLPGEVCGLVGLAEVTLHGWDLARASGQEYACDDATAQVLTGFLGQFDSAGTPGLYGPAVSVGEDASAFDRVLAASGRDPQWVAGAAGSSQP